MDARYEKLMKCLEYVKSRTDFVPEIALTLGSGLGDYAKNMQVECEIPYSEIPGFPVSTAPGHDGRFIFGTIGGRKLVCMKGRVHYYEGYDISDVVLPARLMGLMGAGILFLTNASGGINHDFKPGDFMLVKDHISVFAPNPLIGPNIDELGVRFPDMSHVYDKGLQDKIRSSAKEPSAPPPRSTSAAFWTRCAPCCNPARTSSASISPARCPRPTNPPPSPPRSCGGSSRTAAL